MVGVWIVGDHTEGIFSDMYEFRLPNKWSVTLSHQQYFSATMKNYEGRGTSPGIVVLNTRTDLEKGVDTVLARAIEYLEVNH